MRTFSVSKTHVVWGYAKEKQEKKSYDQQKVKVILGPFMYRRDNEQLAKRAKSWDNICEGWDNTEATILFLLDRIL